MKRSVFLKSLVAGCAIAALGSVSAHAECRGGYLWSDQGQNITIIAGDGIPDPFQVFPLGVKGENFTFVITDSESNILVYPEGNTFDLEGAGVGKCLVYEGDYAKARTYFDQVVADPASVNSKSLLSQVYTGLGDVKHVLGSAGSDKPPGQGFASVPKDVPE